MKFTVARETLLRPLSILSGVVARRHTLPILSHLRIDADEQGLTLTGSDLEVELIWRVQLEHLISPGSITVPAKKLSDICKSLSEGSVIDFELADNRAVVKSGRSRFVLATLPSSEFPGIQLSQIVQQVSLPQRELLNVIQRNEFAMARQDVRYYLNGMYFELQQGRLRSVATDGHRLSLADTVLQESQPEQEVNMIVPAKAVHELAKLLDNIEEPVSLIFGEQHFQVNTGHSTFVSKQIEGRYPDYERVIPRNGDKLVVCDRLELRQMLSRISILANEKFQGIRLNLSQGNLSVTANNPEQEQAEESMEVNYQGESLEIGFNVGYLIDVMDNIGEEVEQVQIALSDPASSALIQAAGGGKALYVVMPMRL
ncbi:DNA polymerase-3 subunit beta [Marinospirillum celere]|uniref:Beta sliding clamp n=1 Tax=Marinospirillum celere TaxID=1122252 RepID=A0A1I1I7N8_9GAMM|nr:DNA polymerase III subunit beta [Marinospirillum celere]SFC32025.1 DNA polymerase-3 subunit beta [Marinospirillum celere]